MDSTGISLVSDPYSKWVKKTLDPNNMQGGIARIYAMYQALQANRFQTENASEGSVWPDLNEDYKEYKLKRYGGGKKRPTKKDPRTQWASWPGGGRKMLIGTGTLAGAVIGPSKGNPFDQSGIFAHNVLFTSNSLMVTISSSGINAEGKPFNYPQYVNEKRPFMKFSSDSIDQMKQALSQFILGSSHG